MCADCEKWVERVTYAARFGSRPVTARRTCPACGAVSRFDSREPFPWFDLVVGVVIFGIVAAVCVASVFGGKP